MKTLKYLCLCWVGINFLIINLQAQELTIYILPSPVDRSWESPREIIVSTIKNIVYPEKYKKRFIGHAFIALSDGTETIVTGSSPASVPQLKRMVIQEGYGLGVLNAEIEGKLESKEALTYALAKRYKHGNISFLRYKISPKMYDRLKYYLTEYDNRDYDMIYNGQNKPREGKGAGCTAFAVSFLEVAGFLKDDMVNSWRKNVRVPVELIGDKINQYRVSALKVIRTKKWAVEEEPYVLTCFYDPNSMHNWVKDQFYKGSFREAKRVKHNRAIGVVFDYSTKPCPDEDIFFGPPTSNQLCEK